MPMVSRCFETPSLHKFSKPFFCLFCNFYCICVIAEDQFFALLSKVQNHNLDDQRGVISNKNLELPDFLKVNDPTMMDIVKTQGFKHNQMSCI